MTVYTLPSCDGRSSLHGIRVMPVGTPVGIVIFTTGMAEYVERYIPYMEALARRGLICVGHNYIGHKDSMADEADLGYLPLKTGLDIIVEDLLADSRRIRQEYPGLPLVLFGHSMGSLVARVTLARAEKGLYQAAVICGTGGPNHLARIGRQIIRLVAKCRGERAISPFCQKLVFGAYNKKNAHRTEFDWLSTDEHEVELYVNDPYCGFPFTAAALYVLVSFSVAANREKTYSDIDKELPIFMITGMQDVVADYGKGAMKVEAAFCRHGLKDLRANYYPNVRHELHKEPIREQIFEEVGQWICSKIR